MSRTSIVVIGCLMICCISGAVGCEQMKRTLSRTSSDEPMSMHEMKRPSPPVQLRQLDAFLGTWEGTAEMVAPAGSPAATQPAETFKGGATYEWTMDGMALKSSGWHEMGEGQQAAMIEYITWDPKAQKFRTYYLSNWGETGTGWLWADPGGQRFHWTGKGSDARGQTSTMSGTMDLVDKDTFRWNMTGEGPMGSMRLKGTSTRTAAGGTTK
jgi:hypothetical protein